MAAAAVMAGVQVYQGVGQARAMEAQAEYQKEMSDINARNAQLMGERVIKQGDVDAATQKKKINQILGQQRAGFASQGVEVGYGTAQKIQDETMATGVEEIQSIRNNAFLTAMGYQAEAQDRSRNARMAVSGAQTAGSQTILAGGLSAARTLNENGYFDKGK